MAQIATTPTPSRMARVIHWLFPSRRQVALAVAVEIGLTLLGFPIWTRLLIEAIVHIGLMTKTGEN